MITEEDIKRIDPLGMSDIDCSLEQFEKEVGQVIKEMLEREPEYWKKQPKKIVRKYAIDEVWARHSKHYRHKFCESGAPDEIFNEDGTPYIPDDDE
ncbi:MAG: hypothetical protein LKE33_07595 [Acidaminococcus sp.]|jgi:hypothetical protein|nr:hypothetical protein [Acidaminococcus sp.]MCI2100814.1 hypothetical protein [Acidaminococcus sp.]MCI2115140.1 hypothetical protein [Acidaminococcus sp.]MCI2117216.1 hypothetical protein [Acidaminococcus sp.]